MAALHSLLSWLLHPYAGCRGVEAGASMPRFLGKEIGFATTCNAVGLRSLTLY